MPYSPAGIIARLSNTRLRNITAAIIGGVISGASEYVVHTAVLEVHLSPGSPAIVDSALVAIFTSVFLFIVLREWRLRRTMVLEQLHTVAELNHHVRNALQRLMYSQFLPPQEQAEAILESVNRIDRTLKELFPVVGVHPAPRRTMLGNPRQDHRQAS